MVFLGIFWNFYAKKLVVLKGEESSWDKFIAGVLQGFILGPLLFLIYINDLSNGFSSKCKLFADNTSLFPVVNNIHRSATTFSEDLNAATKQAQEEINI